MFSATASASGAMRLAMPVSTLPAPTSAKRVTPPSPGQPLHALAPAHPAGDLLDQQAADRVGVEGRPGGDVGHQRRARRAGSSPRPAPRPSRRRPAASAGSGRAPRRSAGWRGRPVPWPSRSPGPPPPCRRRSPHCRRCCRWRPRRRRPSEPAAAAASARATSLLGPISEAMAPAPTGTARCMAWPRSFSSRAVSARLIAPAAARAEYSPRRVAGDEGGAGRCRRRTRASSAAHHRQAHRHQRRLGVLGQGQLVARALAHQLEELLAQGVVDLLEHLAGGGEGVGQVGAHADGLAALAGKEEGEAHEAGVSRRCRIRGGEG